MNKLLFRSVILAIVIVLFLFVLFRNRSPFGKSNSSFASDPGKEITRIELTEGGKRLTLEKKKDEWMLNGKMEARKSAVLFIVRILKEMQIKSPVSPELYKNEIKGKNIVPVKVKVFDRNRLLKSFLVFKTQSNAYGNIMKIKESSKPFIVYVPGYEGDIGSGFTTNELFWQPYTVFNLLPSEISSVSFENLTDTSSSFKIINSHHHFYLSGSGNSAGYDSSLVYRYISYFAWIPFESWAFNLGEEDRQRIEAQPPLYRIAVSTSSGSKKVLTLWGITTDKNGTKTTDSDRVLGKTDEKDALFIMRYFDIDPLIKKRSYFFPQ